VFFSLGTKADNSLHKMPDPSQCLQNEEQSFWKNRLKGSYGSDGQNNENFSDVRFVNKQKALRLAANCRFMSSTPIAPDLYLVEKDPLSASCKKPLQSAFATLSNAKYWFTAFVYKFLFRCLDLDRLHFIVCDTDSYMWAVADTGKRKHVLDRILSGLSPEKREMMFKKRMIVPHFEDIVKDRAFYEVNYPLWFPKKKTLLTLEYEHCCVNLMALAPKNYWCDNGLKTEFRSKGVSTRGNLNQELTKEATVRDCLVNKNIIPAENYVLRQNAHVMTKQILRKTGLSGVHTKMIVFPNEACCPFAFGVKAADYHC
jgi:hypothetical protein